MPSAEALKDLRWAITTSSSQAAQASISQMGIGGFQAMTALCESEDPIRASIPFDKDRSGFAADSAAMLVLGTLEHATKRGAKIYAELVGYGTTSDSHHITTPAPNGGAWRKSHEMAIQNAGLFPEDISYINAHGTKHTV